MSSARKTVYAAVVASILLNVTTPAFAQPVIECRRNNCHEMHSHGGTTVEDWLGLGLAAGVICIFAGCLGAIGGGESRAAPSSRERDWLNEPGRTPDPPQGYNMFDHVQPLPGYGVGE